MLFVKFGRKYGSVYIATNVKTDLSCGAASSNGFGSETARRTSFLKHLWRGLFFVRSPCIASLLMENWHGRRRFENQQPADGPGAFRALLPAPWLQDMGLFWL